MRMGRIIINCAREGSDGITQVINIVNGPGGIFELPNNVCSTYHEVETAFIQDQCSLVQISRNNKVSQGSSPTLVREVRW